MAERNEAMVINPGKLGLSVCNTEIIPLNDLDSFSLLESEQISG